MRALVLSAAAAVALLQSPLLAAEACDPPEGKTWKHQSSAITATVNNGSPVPCTSSTSGDILTEPRYTTTYKCGRFNILEKGKGYLYTDKADLELGLAKRYELVDANGQSFSYFPTGNPQKLYKNCIELTGQQTSGLVTTLSFDGVSIVLRIESKAVLVDKARPTL